MEHNRKTEEAPAGMTVPVEKKVPINSGEGSHVDLLLMSAALGVDTALEMQGKRSQDSLVQSDTLPSRFSGREGKEILEAAGVKFLGPVQGDPLFQCVELPAGWIMMATDHYMWTNLVDEKGRRRASIFYKPEFYDRDAHIDLSCRFAVNSNFQREKDEGVAVFDVRDCDRIIFSTEPAALIKDAQTREDRLANYALEDEARAAAVAWLEERYPDWKNPGAYWDQD